MLDNIKRAATELAKKYQDQRWFNGTSYSEEERCLIIYIKSSIYFARSLIQETYLEYPVVVIEE